MKKWAVLLFLMLTFCTSPRPSPSVMQFRPPIADILFSMGRGLDYELPVYLLGEVKNDTLFITGLQMPVIKQSHSSAVTYIPETEDNYVGIWHNHPNHNDLCFMSQADITSALNQNQLIVFIVQTRTKMCYWTIDEVEEHAERRRPKN